ncbi:FAD-binding oxidoreductase [Allomesorhizobium camelthorni]|uniref:FAD-binding oxidoreductase n=1 Tax=Allomesorhizobium camelthorni TaxID=475069 RepID=UPI00198259B7|nr:FAD-binding oxidoreductase [Mesorhizobium camelthorni]
MPGTTNALRPPDAALIAHLRELLGPDGVVDNPDLIDRYNSDPYGGARGGARIVLRPRATQEVAAIVSACAAAGVGIVPRGGGTGFLGGARARYDGSELVLSLERMRKVREIDIDSGTITVEAGCILADVQAAAASKDRLFPLSLGAEGSCHIGGNLATNAGGIQVLRYGNARDLCLGLEVVLPDGSIVDGLRALRKDNSGYDLRNLFIGSEGTLGIITAAVLKLFPVPAQTVCAIVGVLDAGRAVALLHQLQALTDSAASCFEFMPRGAIALAREVVPDLARPFGAHDYDLVLMEVGGSRDNLGETVEAALAGALEDGLANDVVIAASEVQRRSFWRIREAIPEAIGRLGWIITHDVSVPLSRVAGLTAELQTELTSLAPDCRLAIYGHLGDGNLHVSVLPPAGGTADADNTQARELSRLVLSAVVSHRGSISAEHGIGEDKAQWLQQFKSSEELDLMRRLKRALDPLGIMNPRKVLTQLP